jgi:hypothetical protein
LLSALLFAACNKSEKAPSAVGATVADTEAATEDTAEEPAEDCKEEATEAVFQKLVEAMKSYASLEYPKADADCETLRLFTVDLAPLAQAAYARLTDLKAASQSQSEQCRAFNKEKFGPRMQALMTESQKKLGPSMEAFETAVRGCKDHPGMAEAFQAASFPLAK